jgi:hypothetical protein
LAHAVPAVQLGLWCLAVSCGPNMPSTPSAVGNCTAGRRGSPTPSRVMQPAAATRYGHQLPRPPDGSCPLGFPAPFSPSRTRPVRSDPAQTSRRCTSHSLVPVPYSTCCSSISVPPFAVSPALQHHRGATHDHDRAALLNPLAAVLAGTIPLPYPLHRTSRPPCRAMG